MNFERASQAKFTALPYLVRFQLAFSEAWEGQKDGEQ